MSDSLNDSAGATQGEREGLARLLEDAIQWIEMFLRCTDTPPAHAVLVNDFLKRARAALSVDSRANRAAAKACEAEHFVVTDTRWWRCMRAYEHPNQPHRDRAGREWYTETSND